MKPRWAIHATVIVGLALLAGAGFLFRKNLDSLRIRERVPTEEGTRGGANSVPTEGPFDGSDNPLVSVNPDGARETSRREEFHRGQSSAFALFSRFAGLAGSPPGDGLFGPAAENALTEKARSNQDRGERLRSIARLSYTSSVAAGHLLFSLALSDSDAETRAIALLALSKRAETNRSSEEVRRYLGALDQQTDPLVIAAGLSFAAQLVRQGVDAEAVHDRLLNRLFEPSNALVRWAAVMQIKSLPQLPEAGLKLLRAAEMNEPEAEIRDLIRETIKELTAAERESENPR